MYSQWFSGICLCDKTLLYTVDTEMQEPQADCADSLNTTTQEHLEDTCGLAWGVVYGRHLPSRKNAMRYNCRQKWKVLPQDRNHNLKVTQFPATIQFA